MSLDIHLMEVKPVGVFDANITHNLNRMAAQAGLYLPLWRPEELGVKSARELIPYLELGLTQLKAAPAYFKAFDAENGWGKYDDFVPWIELYLRACKKYPNAQIRVSR